MIFKTFLSTAAAVAALVSSATASMAPTYPSPGTVWTSGQEYTLTWTDDSTAPDFASGWTNFKIQFMTGSNLNQTVLSTVATDLDATKISSYTWTAPEVDPNSAIYFFMYTNADGVAAWTTRFGIVAKAGDALVPETETVQPDGPAIPWGNGKLAKSVAAPAAGASASASASAVAPADSVIASANVPSSSPVASSSASSNKSPAAADPSKDASSASASTATEEKINQNSGVDKMFRVPLSQVALAIVAVAAFTLS
ncbi:hypothetical protein BX666DRAFT_1982485 [Dichotomocladium elegans]|nr:hypothetical protein BX666DRAFT_1982485 [Dichotomocladium elegans]